ncbi:MAG: LamG-like jellyroll fold domain-containing protein [Bacteroidota bacterium]
MKTFSQLILLLCGIMLGLRAQTSNGLVASYPLDVSTWDASGNGNDGTPQNPGQTSNRFGDASKAREFNGSSDFIDLLPNTADFKPQLPVTISAWIQLDDLEPNMVFKNDYQDNKYTGVWLNIAGGGTISAGFGDGGNVGSSSRRSAESELNLETGIWYHIGATIHSASHMDLYLNGLPICETYSGTGGALQYSNNHGAIGRSDNKSSPAAGLQFFHGKIDNVRFYDRALAKTEMHELYTVNENCYEPLTFSPIPFQKVAHYQINNGLAPDLHSSNEGTVHGAVADIGVCDNIDGSLSFDGVDDYIELQANTPTFQGSLPMTITAFIYLEDHQPNMVFKNEYVDDVYSGVWLNITGSGKVSAGFGNDGPIGPSYRRTKTGETVLNLQEWYHVAAVISSKNDIEIYVNGVNDCGSITGFAGIMRYHGSGISGTIGKSDNFGGSGGLQFFHGKIDEVHVFNQALKGGDIFYQYDLLGCKYECSNRLGARPASIDMANEIQVYPNPNNGVFHIQFSEDADAQLSLRDLSGRTVWSQQTSVSKYEALKINVPLLPAGIYLLSSEIQGQLTTHKVVIN